MANTPLIWIVEDDPSTQRLVAEHLRVNGFETENFDSAEKAFAALRAGKFPALMILDMLLPGMSGVDLVRLMKQNKDWEKIPVVVVTVLSRKDVVETNGEDMSAYWINKPFDANNLVQTIQKVLMNVGKKEKLS